MGPVAGRGACSMEHQGSKKGQQGTAGGSSIIKQKGRTKLAGLGPKAELVRSKG